VVPLASPVTVRGLAEPAAVIAPGLEVAVYPVIVAPPLLTGAVNATVACAFPAVAVPIVGAPGTVIGSALKLGFLHVVKKIHAIIRNGIQSFLVNMIFSFKVING
jgi:hypothetical protein